MTIKNIPKIDITFHDCYFKMQIHFKGKKYSYSSSMVHSDSQLFEYMKREFNDLMNSILDDISVSHNLEKIKEHQDKIDHCQSIIRNLLDKEI